MGTKGAVPCEEEGGKQESSWISETGAKVGRQSQNPKINKSSHWLSDSYFQYDCDTRVLNPKFKCSFWTWGPEEFSEVNYKLLDRKEVGKREKKRNS